MEDFGSGKIKNVWIKIHHEDGGGGLKSRKAASKNILWKCGGFFSASFEENFVGDNSFMTTRKDRVARLDPGRRAPLMHLGRNRRVTRL